MREDLARKASIACAILWNFWVLATYLFLLFLSGILQYSYAKGCGRFLEQPLFYLDKGKGNDKMNVRIIILVRFRNSKIRELFHSIFLF